MFFNLLEKDTGQHLQMAFFHSLLRNLLTSLRRDVWAVFTQPRRGLWQLRFCFLVLAYIGSANSANISDVIENIRQQGLQVIYSNQHLDANKSIVYDEFARYEISDLKQYLNAIGFELIQVKELIYIIKPQSSKNQHSSSGIVVISLFAEGSKQRITQASVSTDKGVSLNIHQSNGVYSIIDLPLREQQIYINASGYYPYNLKLKFSDGIFVSKDVFLKQKPETLERVLVTASKHSFVLENTTVSKNSVSAQELMQTPNMGNDPVRAMNRLAGLTGNGISARSYVRGGKLNESGIIFNGLDLNNPYHFNDFFGIFSTFDLSYVQDVSLYAGVFPTRYGNYISSVMDVTSLKVDRPFFLDASIGILNSHVTAGGEISKSSNYLLSIRSGGDFFRTDLLPTNVGSPEYDDEFLTVSYDFGNGVEVRGNVLFSNDEVAIDLVNEDEFANASNQRDNLWFSVKDRRLDNLTLNHMFYSQTKNSSRQGMVNNGFVSGNIFKAQNFKEFGLNSEIDIHIGENTSLNIGNNWAQLESTSNFSLSKISTSFITPLLNQESSVTRDHRYNLIGREYSFFANLRHRYGSSIFVDAGIRYDRQSWIEREQISPRINMSYFYDTLTIFRVGYGRQQQIQNLGDFLFEDKQLSYYSPEIVDVFILEGSKEFERSLSLRAEIYFKNYQSVLPYYENLFLGLQLNPELFADRIRISPLRSYARGVDITLAKIHNNLSWSIAYSFSNVEDVFKETTQSRSWNQRNGIKLNANWQYKKWNFNSLVTYHSGWPKTNIISDGSDFLVQNRNAGRFGDFISVDLRFERQFKIAKTDSSLWLQVTNALNRNNECCIEYSYQTGANNPAILNAKSKSWLPMIPSFGINLFFD